MTKMKSPSLKLGLNNYKNISSSFKYVSISKLTVSLCGVMSSMANHTVSKDTPTLLEFD